MALTRREQRTPTDVFDRFLGRWPEFLHRPLLMWPAPETGIIDVEEYREDDTLVIRAELPGVDPVRDIEVTVEDDTLKIAAERKEEEMKEGKEYALRELRYGSFHRYLPLPAGTEEADVKATYRDGVLEVRVPVPDGAAEKRVARKIAITAS